MTPPKQGSRAGWVPSSDDDYGDGGAFPEIDVEQYPLGIGRIGDLVSIFSHESGVVYVCVRIRIFPLRNIHLECKKSLIACRIVHKWYIYCVLKCNLCSICMAKTANKIQK